MSTLKENDGLTVFFKMKRPQQQRTYISGRKQDHRRLVEASGGGFGR